MHIPGYTFIHQHRSSNRGGGVGFYINNKISFKILSEHSLFTDNVFESLTIQAKISNKSYVLSSIYKSTSPPRNSSLTEQTTKFTKLLDTMLSNLNKAKLNTYIFLDSNINLLHIQSNPQAAIYLETILNNGYMQLITKATRIQNSHFSLIDHIITNTPSQSTITGTLISDISDHFITFTTPKYTKIAKPPASKTARNFSKENIDRFKLSLRTLRWHSTFTSSSASESFDNFWEDFKAAYDTNFPECTFKTNKNCTKIKNFLTPELLTSRNTKLTLHKLSLTHPTPENISNYKKHRNLFNSAVRRSKLSYFENNLTKHIKDPKKTWQLLKEAANFNSTSYSVSELRVNNTSTTNELTIANEFNSFFSTIGLKISNAIPPSNTDPLSYCTDFPDALPLDLAGTGPVQVGDTIKLHCLKLALKNKLSFIFQPIKSKIK